MASTGAATANISAGNPQNKAISHGNHAPHQVSLVVPNHPP
jgi:hypothetical protein